MAFVVWYGIYLDRYQLIVANYWLYEASHAMGFIGLSLARLKGGGRSYRPPGRICMVTFSSVIYLFCIAFSEKTMGGVRNV